MQIFIANRTATVNYKKNVSHYDDAVKILASITDHTVFYIVTHANQAAFGDCYDDMADTLVTYLQVSASVSSKGPNIPPYNLVFVDACISAGNGEVEYDGARAFGTIHRDQAFVGWDTFVWCTLNTTWTDSVWVALTDGETIYNAITEKVLLKVGHQWGAIEWLPIGTMPVIVSDSMTKLHQVYLGNGEDEWFRAHTHKDFR